MSSTDRKLPLKVKIGYGIGGSSYFIAYNLLALYLIWFFTESVGLSPAFAGLIASLGILWDAISDPLVGMMSDNRPLEKGRRRPFLKWVAIPFGLAIWLMFTNFNLSEGLTKVYFIVVALMYYTGMTVFDIPFTALGAEMTTDYDERSSLALWRNVLSQVANFLTALVFFVLPFFMEITGSMNGGWSLTMAIFGILAAVTIFIAWRATNGYELKSVIKHERVGYKDYINVLKNKPFRNVVYMYTLSIFGMGFVNTLLLYFLFFVGGLGDAQVPIALMIVFGFSIVWAPIIEWISMKWSKKTAWVFGMGSWAITLSLFPLLLIPNAANPVMVSYLMLFFSAIGCTSQYQVAWAMIPDCVELDELQTGHRREGLFYATVTFIQKVATAIAMGVAGWALGAIGYTDGGELTPQIINSIRTLFAYGASIPLALSALIVTLTPMTRSTHAALMEAVNLKKQGKTFSVEGFRRLFNTRKEIEALSV